MKLQTMAENDVAQLIDSISGDLEVRLCDIEQDLSRIAKAYGEFRVRLILEKSNFLPVLAKAAVTAFEERKPREVHAAIRVAKYAGGNFDAVLAAEFAERWTAAKRARNFDQVRRFWDGAHNYVGSRRVVKQAFGMPVPSYANA